MCMDKRNEFGETIVYFSQMKKYLRLSKKSAVLWITLPYMYYLYKKMYNIAIEASVRTTRGVQYVMKTLS